MSLQTFTATSAVALLVVLKVDSKPSLVLSIVPKASERQFANKISL